MRTLRTREAIRIISRVGLSRILTLVPLRTGSARKRFMRGIIIPPTEMTVDKAKMIFMGITSPFARGNYAKRQGERLLREAISKNDNKLVTYLIKQGARPQRDAYGPGVSPLECHYLGQFYAINGPLYRRSRDKRFGALGNSSVDIPYEVEKIFRKVERSKKRDFMNNKARAHYSTYTLTRSMRNWHSFAVHQKSKHKYEEDPWDLVD